MRRVEAYADSPLRVLLRLSPMVLVFTMGCADPCSRLLETMCKDMPNEQFCRSYREKVAIGDISPEMCRATRRAYVNSLEETANP